MAQDTVSRHPVETGGESPRAAKSSNLPEQLQEGFLGQIFCRRRVGGHANTKRIDPALVQVIQRLKGFCIPLLSPFNCLCFGKPVLFFRVRQVVFPAALSQMQPKSLFVVLLAGTFSKTFQQHPSSVNRTRASSQKACGAEYVLVYQVAGQGSLLSPVQPPVSNRFRSRGKDPKKRPLRRNRIN